LFWGLGGRQHQSGAGGHARFVVGAVFPEGQQQHGQFACDGDHGAFFLAGTTRAGEALAVFAQGTGGTKGPENIVRGADQQTAHQPVAAFADAQLLIRPTALVPPRTQAQIRPNIAPATEALRVTDLEDEAQRGEWANAGNLLETLGDGIILFATLHQVVFHRFDLFGHLGEHDEQGLHHRQTIGGHIGQHGFVKRLAGGVAHYMAEAFEGEPDGVDEVDAGADEGVPEFEAEQIVLGLGGTVLDGVQQRRVHPCETREHLGIASVTLAFGTGNSVELARIGDKDGGPIRGEEATDPRTMRAGFQRDSGVRELGEQLGQGGPGIGQGCLADNLTSDIKDADVMTPITKIKADGEPARNDDSGVGGGNNRRSFGFIFHKQRL
jgi:hypothetical protein